MNLINKIFRPALALVLLCAGSSLFAAHLTPEEALQRATASKSNALKVRAAADYTLRYSLADEIYVFGNQGRSESFIIVSADDCAEPLLGYADGSFDAGSMPPAMKWWLDQYACQIEAARTQGMLKAVERPQRQPVEPMVKTKWNQNSPFNLMCPVINGGRSMTGCVATAMAQVAKFHQWPEKGVGSHEYYYNGSWISLDFSKISYDWANMLDSYEGTTSERQNIAVAQLMYACGVSTDMQYSPIESGTADVFVASALVDYFNYDKNIRYAERDYFGMLEWEEFIYNQLKDYGPVQYSGSSSSGGHSFVCDGYSDDGFFHINWGWGGMSDGFFRLSALDPAIQGIGGASSGFNFDQAVIANIRKPRANSQMYLNLMMDQGFHVQPLKSTGTRPGDNLQMDRRIINYSIGTAYGSLGFKFTNRETNEVKYSTVNARFNLPTLTPLQGYTANIPSTLRTGEYEVTPVMCGDDGVWAPVPVKLSTNQKMIMTIKNGLCTFAEDNGGTVTVSDMELHTPVYLGNLFRLTATVSNPGTTEFVGQLVPTLASGRSPIAKSDPIPVDLLPGESTELNITGIFNHFSSSALPPAGNYTLYMVKEATNEIVSEGMQVELHAVPENTSITTDDFTIVGGTTAVNPSNITFSFKITCQEGYFGRNLTICIFPYTSGQVTSIAFYSTPDIFLGAGQSQTVTAGGVFGAAEAGKKYFAAIFDGQTSVTQSGKELIFTVGNPSSITSPDAAEQIVLTRIYNTLGTLLLEHQGALDPAATTLSPGIYLIETITSTGTRQVERIKK